MRICDGRALPNTLALKPIRFVRSADRRDQITQAILSLKPSGLHLLPGGAAREDVAELLSGPPSAGC